MKKKQYEKPEIKVVFLNDEVILSSECSAHCETDGCHTVGSTSDEPPCSGDL